MPLMQSGEKHLTGVVRLSNFKLVAKEYKNNHKIIIIFEIVKSFLE